jgi:tetratricopeptide (TPR) repeat protein
MNLRFWKNLLSAAVLVSSPGAAQELDLDDLESRTEYAWFTEDANSLRNLIRAAKGQLSKDSESLLAHYELGLANYRLGVLLMQKSPAESATALSACADELDEVTEADEQFAEAYALQGACYASLADLQALKAMAYAPLSSARKEKAMKLAPQNPRVVLLAGLADQALPRALGGDKARAQKQFARAVQLFEEVGPQEPGGPRWGAADAYLHLGRVLIEAGDTLGARNALERALIIAPEFAAARRELRQLTTTAG